MFHDKPKCVIILIANGWPEEGKEITHYSASIRIDEDDEKLPNSGQKGEKLVPINYRNPMKAKSDAQEFTIEKNKFQLLHYYNEIEGDMDFLKKEINGMKNKLQHLNSIKEKIKEDLTLLGVEVKEVRKKKNELEEFKQEQTMSSIENTITTEEQRAVQGLLDISVHELENEQYVPQRNVQQVLEYPQVHNIPQQQIPQLTQHPQLQNIRYPPPTATVTSHGGPEIIPYKRQNTTYNNQISTVTSDAGSEDVVISLSDAQFKISDQDIITLLTTENTQQTRSQDTILFTQTPTLTTQQQPEKITTEQEETEVPDIEEIPDEPPKKKSKTGNSSKESAVSKEENKYPCDDCGKLFTRRSDVKRHKNHGCRKGRNQLDFKCGQCHKEFANKITLMEHVARFHLNEQPYVCPLCDEKFWNASGYTRHKNSKHPGHVFPKRH